MSRISDEMREWADLLKCSAYTHTTAEKISAFADRIDDEMVELPKDREGKPIHPGDIEYRTNGDICEIYTIEINSGGAYVTAMVGGGTDHADIKDLAPCELSHTMPDSLERIVSDIADFGIGADVDNAALAFLVKIQKRICDLAKENSHVS